MRLEVTDMVGAMPMPSDFPYRDVYTTFITGMACGTDIWAGRIVVRLKDRFPDIRLIAAIPFPEFSDKWEPEWQDRCQLLLSQADLVKTICPDYRETA